ncbi:MAG: hypothetical protein KJ722_03590, partial [Candidatus Omnitrophica bacterium]|nr:hypothetical protein [Candidatus Omnitrophota bacterium]
MAIIFLFMGLALGYAIAIGRKQKKPSLPQELPQQDSIPAQTPSSLADKIWYEAELDFLFKFNEKLSLSLGFQDASECIIGAAHDFLPIERAVLLIWDKNSQNLTLACAI